MIVYLTIFAIGGALLGLRFNVFVLVPAFLLGVAFIIVLSGHHPAMEIALTAFGAVASLQVGYLLGRALYVMVAQKPDRTTAHEPHQPKLKTSSNMDRFANRATSPSPRAAAGAAHALARLK